MFLVKKVRFYKKPLVSKNKLFILVGNKGAEAKCTFFSNDAVDESDYKSEEKINVKGEFNYIDAVEEREAPVLAFLKFSFPILYPEGAICLGMRLETETSSKENRIAFYGKLIDRAENVDNYKVTKKKLKKGKILRMIDDKIAVVVDMFKNVNVIDEFMGQNVWIEGTEFKGIIYQKFGPSGKIKVLFEEPIKDLKLEVDGEKVGFEKFNVELRFSKRLIINK